MRITRGSHNRLGVNPYCGLYLWSNERCRTRHTSCLELLPPRSKPPRMSSIFEIPEIVALDAGGGLIRIPPGLDVPLTPRVRRIIDTPPFRRLAKVNQLGFVSLIYPAAIHTRFEHSLGVYRLALLFLKRLAHDARFAEAISPRDAELFIAAALLHDIGHYPYSHLVEDLDRVELTEEFVAGPRRINATTSTYQDTRRSERSSSRTKRTSSRLSGVAYSQVKSPPCFKERVRITGSID